MRPAYFNGTGSANKLGCDFCQNDLRYLQMAKVTTKLSRGNELRMGEACL
jgi:hypothetical protein